MKRTWRKNRLKQVMQRPGGITVGEALDRADAELQHIHDECVSLIDAKLDRIVELSGALTSVEALGELYTLSDEVMGLAGTFGLGELSEAAMSLCNLLDALGPKLPADLAPLHVHIDALRAMREQAPESDAGARAEVIRGLARLVEHTANELTPRG